MGWIIWENWWIKLKILFGYGSWANCKQYFDQTRATHGLVARVIYVARVSCTGYIPSIIYCDAVRINCHLLI